MWGGEGVFARLCFEDSFDLYKEEEGIRINAEQRKKAIKNRFGATVYINRRFVLFDTKFPFLSFSRFSFFFSAFFLFSF